LHNYALRIRRDYWATPATSFGYMDDAWRLIQYLWSQGCLLQDISSVSLNFITLSSVITSVCSCGSSLWKLGPVIVYTSWTPNRRQLLGYKIFMVWSSPPSPPQSHTQTHVSLCGRALFRQMEGDFLSAVYRRCHFRPQQAAFPATHLDLPGDELEKGGRRNERERERRRRRGGVGKAIHKIPQKWKAPNVACSVFIRISLLYLRLCKSAHARGGLHSVADGKWHENGMVKWGTRRRITRSSLKN
jgi:hypothetical protein